MSKVRNPHSLACKKHLGAISILLVVAFSATTTNAQIGSIDLDAGWNLISFDVSFSDNAPETVFADLISAGILDFVTGFDNGTKFFDPSGPAFLNTLTEIHPGRGYWVKVSAAATLNYNGSPLPLDFSVSLATGWNLIGYWFEDPLPPDSVFTELIDASTLEFVTGFDGGVTFFDPDGLPFLNTLTMVERNGGYWTRVSSDLAVFAFAREIIIAPITTVLDSMSVAALDSISSDNATFFFSAMTAGLDSLEIGDIMVSDTSGAAPNGFLRKVTGIAPAGPGLIVSTEQVTLGEAIEEGQFSLSRALTPGMVVGETNSLPGVRLEKQAGKTAAEFVVSLTNVVLLDVDLDPGTTDDQIIGNGSLTFALDLDISYKKQWWSITPTQILFKITQPTTAEIEVSTNVPAVSLADSVLITTLRFTPITLLVGPVPVVITPNIPIHLGASGNFSVGMTTGFTGNATLEGGVEYKEEEWTGFGSSNSSASHDPPSFSAAADASVFVVATAKSDIYGVAGPTSSAKLFLQAKADLSDDPWWSLSWGFKLGAGFSVELLSKAILSFEANVINKTFPLADAGGPWSYDCSAQTSLPEIECEALVDLYNSTDGANWADTTGWLTPQDICTWKGVICDSGSVSKLLMFNNGLSGPIPPSIGNFANLTLIGFDVNQLTGGIPAELGNLSNLEGLYLNNNQLTGGIPSELGNLSNLDHLVLDTNGLTGSIPTALGGLANLTLLRLHGNALTGNIPSELGNLTNLTGLYLAGNQLSGPIPPSIGNLVNLTAFGLDSNQLIGQVPLPVAEVGVNPETLCNFTNNDPSLCIPDIPEYQALTEEINICGLLFGCPPMVGTLNPSIVLIPQQPNCSGGGTFVFTGQDFHGAEVHTTAPIALTGDARINPEGTQLEKDYLIGCGGAAGNYTLTVFNQKTNAFDETPLILANPESPPEGWPSQIETVGPTNTDL